MSIFMGVFLPLVVTARPLASPDVLEPSVQNEVEHALSVASTNAVSDTAAARAFAHLYATNGLNATQLALTLVSSQKDGCWMWRGTNVTPAAVRILRQLVPVPETGCCVGGATDPIVPNRKGR